MSTHPPIAEKDAGRIDALRIKSDDGTLTFATRHDGQIEAQTSGERVVLDREAVVRLADWLTKHDPVFKSLDAAEANVREQVAREIEAVAASGVHASDEPVFVDAALVARGRWNR